MHYTNARCYRNLEREGGGTGEPQLSTHFSANLQFLFCLRWFSTCDKTGPLVPFQLVHSPSTRLHKPETATQGRHLTQGEQSDSLTCDFDIGSQRSSSRWTTQLTETLSILQLRKLRHVVKLHSPMISKWCRQKSQTLWFQSVCSTTH
jgi:hypothetical protein